MQGQLSAKTQERKKKEDYSKEARKWERIESNRKRRRRTLRANDDSMRQSTKTVISFPSLEVNWCGILSLFLSTSVGVRHHERCRLLLYLCFPVNHGSKVKGYLGCFGTLENARANLYLHNPVVRSQEEP